MRGAVLVLVFFLSITASARKFSFENEGFSTYLRGTGGLSNVAKDVYGKASGANTLFEDKVEFNFSGEVGVALSIASMVIRIGVEGIVPKKQSGIEGTLSSGTKLFDLDSEVLAVTPGGFCRICIVSGRPLAIYGRRERRQGQCRDQKHLYLDQRWTDRVQPD